MFAQSSTASVGLLVVSQLSPKARGQCRVERACAGHAGAFRKLCKFRGSGCFLGTLHISFLKKKGLQLHPGRVLNFGKVPQRICAGQLFRHTNDRATLSVSGRNKWDSRWGKPKGNCNTKQRPPSMWRPDLLHLSPLLPSQSPAVGGLDKRNKWDCHFGKVRRSGAAWRAIECWGVPLGFICCAVWCRCTHMQIPFITPADGRRT